MSISESTPILVGVGQAVSHWDGSDVSSAPSPLSLAGEAVASALQDTGVNGSVKELIDTVVFVRVNDDSNQAFSSPFGGPDNPPGAIADGAGLSADTLIYSTVGGDRPQALVNEFAEKLFDGSAKGVLLTGAEATGAKRLALKKRLKLDWSLPSSVEFDDRGYGKPLASDEDIELGIGVPLRTYPLLENALRIRLGFSRDEYLTHISELFEPFSKVASENPYSQFPEYRDAAFLATESPENYRVTDTYLKWHVAQDAVNLGAALIMTTVGAAREFGIAPEKWVFLNGHAQVSDLDVGDRPDLSRSTSIELSLERALSAAGITADELSLFDLYSCFPCVVQLAAEALELGPDHPPLTVTGGLPFFGGPGNNFSMHAIASMVEQLRANPGANGIVLANGGYMTKHAVGVYSTEPKEFWAPVDCAELQEQIDANKCRLAATTPDNAVVESYSVSYGRYAPTHGLVISRSDQGRSINRLHSHHRATLRSFLERPEPVGTKVAFHETRKNTYTSPVAPLCTDGDDRTFEYVKLRRKGNLLEVELNRPESYNSLFGPAHYELAEIFDEFERDEKLWVAIITGAGENAFCSGNDLKESARGGDVGFPRSGFAGLTSRFNRTKPVIAAVNGVAMGGGLEIILACDLAVMDPSAKCAVPEVKVGLFAAAGGVQRLTRQIGTKAANEMLLTGRHVEAEEALALGLVNAISAPGNALEEARALAERVLESSPSAIQATKQVLNDFEALDYDLETSLKKGGRIMGKLMRTNDFREGVTAFGEKRPPKWTNS